MVLKPESHAIRVLYLTPEAQNEWWIPHVPGLTVKGILDQLPLKFDTFTVGIFGEIVPADHLIEKNDRLEIYRELIIDPKEARRQRALINRKKRRS